MILVRRPALRVVMAIVWMLLHDVYTIPSFVAGLLVATLAEIIFPCPEMVFGEPRPVRQPSFVQLVVGFARLVLYFTVELLKSNWMVIRLALAPRIDLKPGIIRMELRAHAPSQVTLLSNLITLTPGTLTIEVEPDMSAIYIHAIDATDPEEALKVPRRFEEMILEVIP